MKIIKLEEVDSTNEYLKRNLFGEDTVVIAKRQTGGKGTKGRSFSSNEGGAYLSYLKFFDDLPAKDAFKIMINSCVAVAKTCEDFGVKPTIKWSNDVLINGKKICGILIENTLSLAHICHSIVGIGVNINNDLPDNLSDIATSLKSELKREVDLNLFIEKLIENLLLDYSVETYKSYMSWLGSEVILKTDTERKVKAIDIADDGNLIIEIGGKREKISSAEVSLKL